MRPSWQEGCKWRKGEQSSRDSLHMMHLMRWKPCVYLGRSPFLSQITLTGFPLDTGLPLSADEHLAARCWYTHVHEDKTHLYMSSHQTAVWIQQDSCSELQSMYLYMYDHSHHYLQRMFLANKTKLKFAYGYYNGNNKHHVIQGTDPGTLLFSYI